MAHPDPEVPSGLAPFLIVMTPVVILVTVYVASRPPSEQKGHSPEWRRTRWAIANVESAIKMYGSAHKRFPSGGDEVIRMLSEPQSDGPPLLEGPRADGWNNQLHYQWPHENSNLPKPAIWSDGPNGINEGGNGDDIANW